MTIAVRQLATPEEMDQQFIWADQAFAPTPDPANARAWGQTVLTQPDFRPQQLRGAFREEAQLGGYGLNEWILRIGEARISTGCIGMVVTNSSQRKQGVATAMMRDAIQFAREQGHSLLLLDGIPNFYYRYGYTDVFDSSTEEINRAAILAHPASSHTVRQATPEDAQSIRDLYERRLSGFTGSFERSREKQEHLLRHRFGKNTILLAISPEGKVEGYVLASRAPSPAVALELCADNWPAQIALMQAHAHLSDGPETPATHTYYLPPTSEELYRAIAHLEVPDTSHWHGPAEEWGIRTVQAHHRYAGWMGRIVHLPTFLDALLPELQARWRRSLAHWSGKLHFLVGEESYTLGISGSELQSTTKPNDNASTFQCSPQDFAQLVLGYRPLSWTLTQQPQELSSTEQTVLQQLFPPSQPWISFSDWF
ncbi:GNAT family N-acetyltransferase [Ktedonobacter robiniae]|uniref:N-acetyltransferase domain-containing protein n=1 Tax=Ktedonobacter robiniae TaxID=2778365 RepID=A0ABQ3UHI8_9CHLR|nr:GNAT family N-acetyltransferase [Ktedonobacter robiniae]GHO51912.1 hypothetical protein KSB_03870 [Ktedonobacter robiniae]